MADPEDLKALTSGMRDLSHCDFRGADLSNLDLSDRDFTNSLFQKAKCHRTNFSRSNFTNAKMSFADATGASFDECKMPRMHFGYTKLGGASLKNVDGIGAIFQHVVLTQADLSGADFSGGKIDQDTILEGAKRDALTNFDKVKLIRSTARHPLFEGYVFHRGVLRRLDDAENREMYDLSAPVLSAEESASEFSAHEEVLAPASDREVRFDHNDPGYREARKAIHDAYEAVRKSNEHIENRESALSALSYVQDIWDRVSVSVTVVRVGVVMALEDALELLRETGLKIIIETAKNVVVDFIRRTIGL